MLGDELEVDPGYELALAAALDGRLRAAVAADLQAGCALLDQAKADGGRALILDDVPAAQATSARPPGPGAVRLLDHVRGPEPAISLARLLLRETWVVESLAGLHSEFAGTAVTRAGRVYQREHSRAAPASSGRRGTRAGPAQPARGTRA